MLATAWTARTFCSRTSAPDTRSPPPSIMAARGSLAKKLAIVGVKG